MTIVVVSVQRRMDQTYGSHTRRQSLLRPLTAFYFFSRKNRGTEIAAVSSMRLLQDARGLLLPSCLVARERTHVGGGNR